MAMGLSGRATERWGGGDDRGDRDHDHARRDRPLRPPRRRDLVLLIGAAMVVRGFGIGMSIMPAMTAAYSVLRPDQISHATPQLTTLQRVGGSIGTAILTVDPAEPPRRRRQLAAGDGRSLRHHLRLGDGDHRRGPAADAASSAGSSTAPNSRRRSRSPRPASWPGSRREHRRPDRPGGGAGRAARGIRRAARRRAPPPRPRPAPPRRQPDQRPGAGALRPRPPPGGDRRPDRRGGPPQPGQRDRDARRPRARRAWSPAPAAPPIAAGSWSS